VSKSVVNSQHLGILPLKLWAYIASDAIILEARWDRQPGALHFPLLLHIGSLPTFVSLQMSTGVKTFFAGGLGSFSFWLFAMPFDNVKKYARPKAFTSLNHPLTLDSVPHSVG
jgi:hypothetical protein